MLQKDLSSYKTLKYQKKKKIDLKNKNLDLFLFDKTAKLVYIQYKRR